MNSLGKKRAAILTDVKQDYSVGLDEAFKNTYSFGGGIVVSESDRRAPLDLDPDLPLTDERRYGDTLIRIHERTE